MHLRLLGTLFTTPMEIRGVLRLLMVIPLALAIAVVYKTIRCREVREVPLASVALCVMLVVGMLAVGAGLLLVFQWLA